MWPNPQETADLVTFVEEILNGKLNFCAVISGYHTVKPFYSTHLRFLKKVSAITKCLLYKRFYVIFTGSKFHKFRVFCPILRKLVSSKIIAKSVITHLMFKYRSVSNKNIWKLNNSLFLFSLNVVSAINI